MSASISSPYCYLKKRLCFNVYIGVYARYLQGPPETRRGHLISRTWSHRWFVSDLTWVLAAELRSPGSTMLYTPPPAVSPAAHLIFQDDLYRTWVSPVLPDWQSRGP